MKDKKILAGLVALALAAAGAMYMLPKLSANDGAGTSSEIQTQSTDISSGQNITKGGTYSISGESKGTIYIDTKDSVTLVLDGAALTSDRGPAIYVADAGSITINTVSDSTITVSGTDSTGEDAAIFSKDDITLTGSGTLTVKSRDGDGIHANDSLTIESATIDIEAAADGIDVNDYFTYTSSNVTIDAGSDGIDSGDEDSITSAEDVLITLNGGKLVIKSIDDGIRTLGSMTNNGTDITIKAEGGRSRTAKGIKLDGSFTTSSGSITIDASDDGINANANVTIKSGILTIDSEDDCIHADYMLTVDGGTLKLTGHEGLEATLVTVNDGTIDISASDDGINAAKKVDGVTPLVEINGGQITISMAAGDTDAIDSNGNITINGGTISITGQSGFDWDGSAQLNGGTVTVNGTQVSSLTNQMMGGMGPGGGGMMPGQQGGFAPGQNGGMQPGQNSGMRPGRRG